MDHLLKVSMRLGGYDPQFLFIMSTNKGKLTDRIRGLLVFSEEAAVVQNPVIDNENLSIKM